MRQPESQDRLDTFKKSLKRTIDWETFFHLESGQRASAELLLLEANIISTTKEENYEVNPGIRGIVPTSRPPRNEIENQPTYFVDEQKAKSLYDFYKSKRQQASITKT